MIFKHIKGELNIVADLLSRWGYGIAAMEAPIDAAAIKHEVELLNEMEARVGNLHFDLDNAAIKEFVKKANTPGVNVAVALREMLAAGGQKQKTEKWDRWMLDRISILNPGREIKCSKISMEELARAQDAEISGEEREMAVKGDDGVWRFAGMRIYIPDSLAGRFISHFHVANGHAAVSTELNLLKEKYAFPIKLSDLRQVLIKMHRLCLHCDLRPSII